jgi:AcrR family transcriptional regulator
MMDAMAQLCAERGYEATKIADVVSRAAVARKTLYDNFDGKEDLFLAALEATVADASHVVEDACDGVGGGEAPDLRDARVEAGLGALLALLGERPAAARLVMVEALSATPAAAARYEEAVHRFVALLRRAGGRERRLPETIEETLVGGVAWVVQQQVRRGDAGTLAELRPEMTNFVLSPYHGVGDPAR